MSSSITAEAFPAVARGTAFGTLRDITNKGHESEVWLIENFTETYNET